MDFLYDRITYRRRFEDAHGSEDQLADVEKQCIANEPKHGDRWTLVSKDIENWRSVIFGVALFQKLAFNSYFLENFLNYKKCIKTILLG